MPSRVGTELFRQNKRGECLHLLNFCATGASDVGFDWVGAKFATFDAVTQK